MDLGTFPDSRRGAAAGRRRRRRLLLVLTGAASVVVLGAGVLVALGVVPPAGQHARVTARHSPGPPSPPPPPPRPARPQAGPIGTYRVASQAMVFVDRSRPDLGNRRLPILVRYPVVPAAAVAAHRIARGPFPLVVFAPGYLQCGSSYAALLHAWASAGYVVAAIEFPRTHCHIPVPDEADLYNQPADTSFVMTRLLASSSRPAGVLSGLIDPARIAVAGHSDGGDTAAAVAANTCCLDRRVTAAMILSGAEWPPLRGRYFPSGTPPMLFVQGTDDTWNPPVASTQLYQSDTTGVRYYLRLLDVGHFAPYEGHGRPEPLVARVTVDFLNRYLGGRPGQAAAMAAAGNVPGVAVLGSDGRMPG